MEVFISRITERLAGRIAAPRVYFPIGFDASEIGAPRSCKIYRSFLQYCEDNESFRNYFFAHNNIVAESIPNFTTRVFESFPQVFMHLMEGSRFPRNITIEKKLLKTNGFPSMILTVKMKDSSDEKSKISFRAPTNLDLERYFTKRNCIYDRDQMCWKYNAADIPIVKKEFVSLRMDDLLAKYQVPEPRVYVEDNAEIAEITESTSTESTATSAEQTQKCVIA